MAVLLKHMEEHEPTRYRNTSLDVVKFVAIWMVVWGHCIQHLLSTHPYGERSYVYLYSFHMPLFVILSGYFSCNSIRKHMGLFSRFRQLIIPAIIWMCIHSLPSLFLHTEQWKQTLHLEIISSLWFLKCLFICYTLAYISVRKGPVYVLLSLVVSQVIFFYKIPTLYPCFLFGLMLGMKSYFDNKVGKATIISIFCIWFLCIVFWSSDFLALPIPHYQMDGVFVKNEAINVYKIIVGITGTLICVWTVQYFFMVIDNRALSYVKDKVAQIGKFTLDIYILQFFFLETILSGHVFFDQYNHTIVVYFFFPLLSLFLVLVCYQIAYKMSTNRIFSVCMGRKSYN